MSGLYVRRARNHLSLNGDEHYAVVLNDVNGIRLSLAVTLLHSPHESAGPELARSLGYDPVCEIQEEEAVNVRRKCVNRGGKPELNEQRPYGTGAFVLFKLAGKDYQGSLAGKNSAKRSS
jgi:hypothetical protein